MNIPITAPVTYAVDNVEISQIGVRVNNELSLYISFSWKDADGKVIKTGSNSYTEGELETMFQSKGGSFVPFAEAFKSLYPVGKSPAMWIEISNEGVVTANTGIGVDCPDGICRFTKTVVPEATFNACLAANGLNQKAVVDAVIALVQSLTTN
jgi:hypothetical protein